MNLKRILEDLAIGLACVSAFVTLWALVVGIARIFQWVADGPPGRIVTTAIVGACVCLVVAVTLAVARDRRSD